MVDNIFVSSRYLNLTRFEEFGLGSKQSSCVVNIYIFSLRALKFVFSLVNLFEVYRILVKSWYNWQGNNFS